MRDTYLTLDRARGAGVGALTEVETARALYDRVRRDSNYGLTPYRAINFVAGMMKRDALVVLHAVGVERVWRKKMKRRKSDERPTRPR
jgi:hypothetical protein